jgi:hypothetical protein
MRILYIITIHIYISLKQHIIHIRNNLGVHIIWVRRHCSFREEIA